MIYNNYEISLWTHNDNFSTILGASSAYYLAEAYSPVYNYKTDGEETLKFTIPIKYIIREPDVMAGFDLESISSTILNYGGTTPAVNCYLSDGQFISVSPHIIINDQGYAVIDNSKWYSVLTSNSLLANEKRVKLIFDKGTVNQRIREFVIVNLTQERDGDNLYCNVECSGLAFYELGKIGYNLTFNEDTIIAEEEELPNPNDTISPTLNYWMDKVFPPTGNDDTEEWQYKIAMDYSEIYTGADPAVVYEEPGIVSWSDAVAGRFTPIYRSGLIQKVRFPNIEKSNKYNICQDLAELYGVYIKIEYFHLSFFDNTKVYESGDKVYYNGSGYKAKNTTIAGTLPTVTAYWDKISIDNPYKIIGRQIIFYNKPYVNTEYSITYGDNETSIRKISDSKDIVTKLYVDDIESEYSNSGLISISDSAANISKENFILNFDYYRSAGMLSESQVEALLGDSTKIPPVIPFEELLRAKNLILESKFREKYSYANDKSDIELAIKNAGDKADAALTIANDYEDKISALDAALSRSTLKDTRIIYTVLEKSSGGQKYVNFRRSGIIDNSTFLVQKGTTPTTVPAGSYIKQYNAYGNITGVYINDGTIAVGSAIYFTYDYNLFVYYENEKQTYMDVYNTNTTLKNGSLTQQLTAINALIAACETDINNTLTEKRAILTDFEKTMGYFLREGSWSASDYKGPYQQKTWTGVTTNDGSTTGGCKIFYDTVARSGEDKVFHLVGPTEIKTAFKYIKCDTDHNPGDSGYQVIIPFTNLENLELTEYNGTTVVKKYVNGAHFKAQFCELYSAGFNRPRLVLVLNKDIAPAAGNTLKYGNTTLTINTFTLNANPLLQDRIVYRRVLIPDTKILLNSLELSNGNVELSEFTDYYTFTKDNGDTVVGLKINNNLPGNLSSINLTYKSDRTVEQLYWDALEVSKRSAFPDAKYEVDFIYLQKALNIHPVSTAVPDYQTISQNLNNSIELELASIVRINDYDLELRGVKGIVTEISLSLDDPQSNSFIVQNYRTRFEDIFSRIVASTEQMNSRGLAYERAAAAITPDGGISGNVLQNAIRNNAITFSSGINSEISWGQSGIIIENSIPYLNGVKGQVVIKGGGIFLSDRLDAAGLNRIWTAAITPTGINAGLLTAGRIDTEKINIYSGDQIRFTWNAEGIIAYDVTGYGAINFDKFVKYNEDGLSLIQKSGDSLIKLVEVSWEGFKIRNKAGDTVFDADGNGNLIISGTITAAAGDIGDWSIVDGYLVNKTSNPFTTVGLAAPIAVDDIAIWSGNSFESRNLAPFRLTTDGKLTASLATINGTITATNGAIGNWLINSSEINYGALTNSTGFIGMSPSLTNFWSGGINPTAYFNALVTYPAGSYVIYGGLPYKSIQETLGNLPTNGTYWTTSDKPIAKFYVSDGGLLYANEAKITGEITATSGSFTGNIYAASGTIGDWVLGDWLTNIDGTVGLKPTGITFWAGDHYTNNPPFYVTDAGFLSANNAQIRGTIYASQGYFNGLLAIGVGAPYSSNTTYQKDDIVFYEDLTYQAKQQTTGNLPTNTTYWDAVLPYSFINGGIESQYSLKIGGKFFVDKEGNVIAHNGEFSGKITANSGTIANWLINTNILESQSGAVGLESTTGSNIRSIWAGGKTFLPYNSSTSYVVDDTVTYNNQRYICILNALNKVPTNTTYWSLFVDSSSAFAKFYVTQSGYLYAENASIKGRIEATEGYIYGRLDIGQYTGDSYINGYDIGSYALKIKDGFNVTHNGIMSANGAIIRGDITADTGFIGGEDGWGIYPFMIANANQNTGLYSGTENYYVTNINSGNIRFWAGGITSYIPAYLTEYNPITSYIISNEVYYNNKTYEAIAPTTGNDPTNTSYWKENIIINPLTIPFVVTNTGSLYANKAHIQGEIIAQSGRIENTMTIGDANQGIFLRVSRDPDTQAFVSSHIGAGQVISTGAVGYGWEISNDGTARFEDVNVRGTIRSSVFEYNRISSIGGSIYIAPTIYCLSRATITSHSATEFLVTIVNDSGNAAEVAGRSWSVNDGIIYEFSAVVNDRLVEFTNIRGVIHAAFTDTTIQLRINKDQFIEELRTSLIGTNIVNPGALIIFYGTSGNRQGIYLTALGGMEAGPFIDIVDDVIDLTYTPKVRMGRLDGIYDPVFSASNLSGYGLYSQNAYLRGELVLPNAGITNQTTLGYDGVLREYVSLSPEDQSRAIRFWAGTTKPVSTSSEVASFLVTQDGSLYATKGIFEGIVNATDGIFSGVINAAGLVIADDGIWPTTAIIPPIGDQHFYVAYKKDPSTMDDYILDISGAGLTIFEGGFRAYSDFAAGWRPGGTIANKETPKAPYGYGAADGVEVYPYLQLMDDGTYDVNGNLTKLEARLSIYKQHLVEIIRVNDTNHEYYSIKNENGKLYFGRGRDVVKSKPTYDLLETDIYRNPHDHFIGLNDMSYSGDVDSSKNAFLINGGDFGLILNANQEPVYVGASLTYLTNTVSPPSDALNILGTLNVFDERVMGKKGIISLGGAQLQEARDGAYNMIGINIVI